MTLGLCVSILTPFPPAQLGGQAQGAPLSFPHQVLQYFKEQGFSPLLLFFPFSAASLKSHCLATQGRSFHLAPFSFLISCCNGG